MVHRSIIAPAGSGKTTTLVARLGVLLARGVAAEQIAVATFNRDAAQELSARIADRLTPHAPAAGRIEVRTLHALARQVVLDARGPQELVADRLPLLRMLLRRHAGAEAEPDCPRPPSSTPRSRHGRSSAGRPSTPALVEEYRAVLAARGALDFDDLVQESVRLLETDAGLRRRWQARFTHLCVDEFQDVDAGQLRLVRLLAAAPGQPVRRRR